MIGATKFCDGTGARAPGLRVPGASAVEIEIQVPRYLVELIGDALYLSKRIFDADNTLWHVEPLYDGARTRMCSMSQFEL